MTNDTISAHTAAKVAQARKMLRQMGSALVAYSGGVDSALLLKLAHDELGQRMLGVYISSPIMFSAERVEALAVAEAIGAPVRVVQGQELQDADFCENTPLRCYHCRMANYPLLEQVAEEEGLAVVLDGANVDDVGDYRPGRRAAKAAGVRSPLLESGLTKAEIRAVSRELGLPTWDKPSMPCLASRLPYGTPVTEPVLRQIERAENALRAMGYDPLRVRHHGDVARIELMPERFQQALAERERIVAAVQQAGYLYVALDLQGFRSGNLNRALGPQALASQSEEE